MRMRMRMRRRPAGCLKSKLLKKYCICILQLNQAPCKNRQWCGNQRKPKKGQQVKIVCTKSPKTSILRIRHTTPPPVTEVEHMQMHFSSFQLHCMHKIYEIPAFPHSPGTRTCRDPGAAQTLSAASTCWSRACGVSRSVHHLYRAGRPRIICASPGAVSKIFDSVNKEAKS